MILPFISSTLVRGFASSIVISWSPGRRFRLHHAALRGALVGCLALAACSADDESAADAAPRSDEPSTAGATPPVGARPAANSIMLPTMMESPKVAPYFVVHRPADLSATGQPLPVIVWANGGCFRSDFTWAPLFTRWAAAGFVVLAMTAGPDGNAMAQTTVADQRGLIDWALSQAEAGPYAGKLDTKRIVAAGNSCGGITALGLAAMDERVASVFVLSGSSAFAGANRAVIDAITVPVGYVVGGSQDIAGANATADYDALKMGVPAMIVSRSTGDHRTVSTDMAILKDVAEMALSWIDLTLYGSKAAYDALTSPTVCTGCQSGSMWSLKAKNIETLKK